MDGISILSINGQIVTYMRFELSQEVKSLNCNSISFAALNNSLYGMYDVSNPLCPQIRGTLTPKKWTTIVNLLISWTWDAYTPIVPSLRDMIRGKAPRKKRDKSAMVCIDAANWSPYLRESNIRIDWGEFRSLMEQMFTSAEFHYYDGEITDRWYRKGHPCCSPEEIVAAKKARREFFDRLKQLGYRVVTKPIAQVYDKEHRKYKYKCNFDVELTVDVMDNLDNFDVLVLGSGDGDFVALVKRLKSKLKETYAIAVKGRLSSDLQKAVSYYDYLDSLMFYVKDLRLKK